MALAKVRTEHTGPRKRGAPWGRSDLKEGARHLRREADRETVTPLVTDQKHCGCWPDEVCWRCDPYWDDDYEVD